MQERRGRDGLARGANGVLLRDLRGRHPRRGTNEDRFVVIMAKLPAHNPVESKRTRHQKIPPAHELSPGSCPYVAKKDRCGGSRAITRQ